MVCVAIFFGDIGEYPPIAGYTLNDVLVKMQDKYSFGKETVHESHWVQGEVNWTEYETPDPEDDKIEVWEFNGEPGTAKIIWGFWGWHWTMPEYISEQGKMPGMDRTLYDLAMNE